MASQDLAFTLRQLAEESRPVRSISLLALSDLGRNEIDEFHMAWRSLSANRRLDLVVAMVEQAEANIHMNFHAILRSCLTDENPAVRKLAIEGLWEDERTSLVQPLIQRLAEDASAEVRAAAAISLGRFVLLGVLGEIAPEPARLAEEALFAAWQRLDEPVDVRRRALEGLACISTPAMRELIQTAYYDENELMRQSAMFSMGRSADPRWERYVLAELESTESPMRFEAAVAAGEMGLRRAVRPLVRRLDDSDGNVREAAALALGKIGGLTARRALEALLDGEDERLAQAAEEALDDLIFSDDRLADWLADATVEPAVRFGAGTSGLPARSGDGFADDQMSDELAEEDEGLGDDYDDLDADDELDWDSDAIEEDELDWDSDAIAEYELDWDDESWEDNRELQDRQ